METNQLLSDEQLVVRAQKGDMTAYNALFERYNSKIRQLIYFSTVDPANVNDLTQDVLLKIYRHLPHFKINSQFSTWLYRVTHNTIKNHYRTSNLRQVSEAEFSAEQDQLGSYSPEYLMSHFELNEQIDRALSRLSDELKTCYGLHTFDGQSYESIAKEMNCPIGTVRSRIFRARKLLIDFMDE